MLRYSKGSKALGIDPGDYARVEQVNANENLVTVSADDGRWVTYDPRRLQGVTLYRETDRAFAHGDRVQLTAPDRERQVANRELGTIERIEPGGRLQLRLDCDRTVTFEPHEHRHLDYGYAVTSHSSQGQTADRVLVHVDTGRAGEKLVNRRLAYVALSRGRYDAPKCLKVARNGTERLVLGRGVVATLGDHRLVVQLTSLRHDSGSGPYYSLNHLVIPSSAVSSFGRVGTSSVGSGSGSPTRTT